MLPSAVLVVDSSPITANRVREALAGSGLELVIAADRAQAEAALLRPDLGLLLISTHFPGGDGYEFAAAAHRRHAEAVIYLLCASADGYDENRATAIGVDGAIVRPFSVETVQRHIEAVYGPLGDEVPHLDASAMSIEDEDTVESVEVDPTDVVDVMEDAVVLDLESIGMIEPDPLPAPEPLPDVADERVSSFVPRDWRTHPPVRVDPKVVGPAIERAILEVLPEVVEVVLAKAFLNSGSFRNLLEVAVDEAVRDQLPAIARKLIRERLAEIEAAGEDPG